MLYLYTQIENLAVRIFIFLVFIFTTSLTFAQIDSSYIKPFEEKISIKAFWAKKFVFLLHDQGKEESDTYMPNNPFELGLGLSINNTVLSFSYGYGFDFFRDKKKGKTKSFDFQFHNYGNKYVFDIFFQRYKGFYLEDDDSKNIELFPNLSVNQYGVFGQYVFNGKKFSYKAAYVQNERQLRSAGSFMLGGGVYYTQIRSDNSLKFNDKENITNFQFGISLGYSYTWVIKRNYFVNGSISGGMNIGNDGIDRLTKDKLKIYPSAFPRVSAGYNHAKWSLAFSFIGNLTFPSFSKNNSIGLMSGNFQLTYTQRLNYLPIVSSIIK